MKDRNTVIRLATTLFLVVSLTANTFLSAAGPHSPASQQIRGRITDPDGRPLASVTCFMPDSKKGTRSNREGVFSLPVFADGQDSIAVEFSLVGYGRKRMVVPSTQEQLQIVLEPSPSAVSEIAIVASQDANYTDDLPARVEVLGPAQITRFGASDLTESCALVPGVRPQNNCGVCATTDIRIQGLEGQYTQILINGAPIMSNLASVYGLNGIPSSMIERVEIVKGPGAILFGPDAVAGTINIVLQSPDEMPGFDMQTQVGSIGDYDASVRTSAPMGDSKIGIVASYNGLNRRFDNNADGFTDMPTYNRYSLFSSIDVARENQDPINIGARVFTEERFGGQLGWEQQRHLGGEDIYGEHIRVNRQELFGTIRQRFSPSTTVLSHISQTLHFQDSYYGPMRFKADQFVGFADVMVQEKFSTGSMLTVGISNRSERYVDNTVATIDEESGRSTAVWYNLTAAFAQMEWSLGQWLSASTGLRYNYDRTIGSILQPRLNMLIRPEQNTSLRLSAGNGVRSVNIFTEDHAALTGARVVEKQESLRPEECWNVSSSLSHDLVFGDAFFRFSLDGHYTYFSNQIIPDIDTDPNKIIYRNLGGGNFAETKGIVVGLEHFTSHYTFRGSYEELRAESVVDGVRQSIPFNARNRIVASVSSDKLPFGLTGTVGGEWVGIQRIPSIENAAGQTLSGESDPFYLVNAEVKKSLGDVTLGVAINNIFGYVQPNPLVDPASPFGPSFETARVFGPLVGTVTRITLGYSR